MLRSWVRLPYSPLESSKTFVFGLFLFLDVVFRKSEPGRGGRREKLGRRKKAASDPGAKAREVGGLGFAEREPGGRSACVGENSEPTREETQEKRDSKRRSSPFLARK